MRHIILIFALISLLAAVYFVQQKVDATISVPETPGIPQFQIPKIVGAGLETSSSWEENSIIWDDANVIGKYPFQSQIRIHEENRTGLSDVCIPYYFYENFVNGHGLRLVPDYLTTIPIDATFETKNTDRRTFPVYLINETAESRFIYSTSEIDAIVEALDEKDHWFPIHTSQSIGCGTGKNILEIYPGEMVLIAMPKFKGKFKTKMRVRARIGNDILTSETFDGWINPSQFYLDETDAFVEYYRHSVEVDPFGAAFNFFAGTLPKEYFESLKY